MILYFLVMIDFELNTVENFANNVNYYRLPIIVTSMLCTSFSVTVLSIKLKYTYQNWCRAA